MDDRDSTAAPGDRFGGEVTGLVWDAVTAERVTAHLDVDERHHQPAGLVHGGVWCTVVESMASFGGAVAVAEQGMTVVGVSNATDFIRGHRTGRVNAVAEPIHVGRTQQLWEVHIRRAGDEKLVARGQVRLQNVPLDAGLIEGPQA